MSSKDNKPKQRRRRRRRQTRHQEPERKQEEGRFDSLKHQLEDLLGEEDARIVVEPSGQMKMSEVLEAFAAPYFEETGSIEEDYKLFSLAALAWNASLLPEDERREMIEDIIDGLLERGAGDRDNEALRTDMLRIMNKLVKRKLKYYADIERFILNIELGGTGDDYELQVASTLKPPD